MEDGDRGAHQQWRLRRAWLPQGPPRSFPGKWDAALGSATSPSPVRVGTPAWSLEARGSWGPPSGQPRLEGARAGPGIRGPAGTRHARPAAPPAGRALNDRRSGFRRRAWLWAKVAPQSRSSRAAAGSAGLPFTSQVSLRRGSESGFGPDPA